MPDEKKDFADALLRFIEAELRESDEPADYNSHAVQVVDARNHLFRNAGRRMTDEQLGVYAIRELCRVDEDTMETVPDRRRVEAIAKAYFD